MATFLSTSAYRIENQYYIKVISKKDARYNHHSSVQLLYDNKPLDEDLAENTTKSKGSLVTTSIIINIKGDLPTIS